MNNSILLLILTLVSTISIAAPRRSLMRIDPASVTISGVSSGAFMAVQMAVSHSNFVQGVASIAGGIYGCAEGSSQTGQNQCMSNPRLLDSKKFIALARDQEAKGLIDPLANMSRMKAYVFSSKEDHVINQTGSFKLNEFLSAFMPPSQIFNDAATIAPHGLPTLDQGSPCKQMGIPWINNCNYDLAGRVLTAFYGNLAPRGVAIKENLSQFDQHPFATAEAKMFSWGAVYVPTACKQRAPCRLHIALHGCQQNPDFIQDKFFTMAGFNEWAETNRIVVVYPQNAKADGNPYACWDWFGYTGKDYINQRGPQIQALTKIIEFFATR